MDRLSRWLLELAGWRVRGGPPALDKYVVVFYPHTSNWDFVLGILAAWALGLHADFLAKNSLFHAPFGWFFRALGGHPVHRGERENVVSEVAQFVESRERVVLALAPEGTRKWTDHWKSGFYYIALEAKVPVVLGYLDASTRTLGLGPVVQLTGDREQDLEVIRKFYEDKRGLRPEQASTIALR
jgi:1-acyl-sn-glycerol-3-phosphate acyltransferase